MNNIIATSAQTLGRVGGSSRSEAKTSASRKNGAQGGRPRKAPVINDDGASIKGCKYIYAPKGQAAEYAELAVNPYKGCGHGCAYCYVPRITKQNRSEFNQGANVRDNFIYNLSRDADKYRIAGIKAQAMLSFTSDPYPPEHHYTTRECLEVISSTGLGFCTLTKGGTRAIRDIDMFRTNKDSFATTMTSIDAAFSSKWEPGAASPKDRMEALQEFYNAGIFTWVSLEPTIDVNASKDIILSTHKYVDFYKIGRVNYLPMTKTTDWEDYTHKMIELCNDLGVKHYIKKDLQGYLPEGYVNPVRVTQHH